MHLVTNSVDSSSVREVTEDGTRYLVADDIRFIQPQILSNGYVPEKHVRESAGDWDGQPLTANHPTNDAGQLVSANTEHGAEVGVGHARSPTENADGSVSADLWVDADRAEQQGSVGEAVVSALENGDGLEVSSQYFGDDLPPGEYDGEYRADPEGNLVPDSIALLPSSKGVCSLPDCGIAPDGGSAVTANADHLSVTAAPADGDDAPATDDSLVRRGLALLGAAFGADATGGAAAMTGNCAGACDCGTDPADATPDADEQPSNSDEPAESGTDAGADADDADPTSNQTQSNMVDIDRDMLVKAVANQGNLDQATLEELSDDAIATIYKSIVESDSANDDAPDDGDGADQQQVQTPQPPTGNTDDGVVVLSANAVPDAVADGEQSLTEHIDERVADGEQQSETEEAVDKIIANSAEYDDDDRDALLDTDDSVLGRIAAGVDTGSDGLPGRSGATANAATPGADEDTDADAYGTGVAEH